VKRQAAMLRLWVLWLALLAGMPGLHAQLVFRDIEATGHGGDESSATVEALQNALAMVGGMRLSASASLSVSESVRNDSTSFKQDYRQDIERVTRGVVKSYSVLEKGVSPGSGQVFVRIRASIPSYTASEQLKRLKLAVAPLALEPQLARDPDARAFAGDVSAAMEAGLTQSRRFAMLDRRHGEHTARELSATASGATPIEETVKLGIAAGADYLVVASLRSFSPQQIQGRSPIGRPVTRLSAPVTIDVRVIDIASRQIKFAHSYVHPGRLVPGTGLNRYAADVGADIAEAISTAIYPIAVVGVQGGSVTLNQGGDAVQVGRIYRLVSLGRKLVDPYTRESLGEEEHEVGRVEITSVTDRTATARVISGQAEARGQMLLRPVPAEPAGDPPARPPAPAGRDPQPTPKSDAW
jgi:curli biogenesis system outer membrane secretion channel CsgG